MTITKVLLLVLFITIEPILEQVVMERLGIKVIAPSFMARTFYRLMVLASGGVILSIYIM